MKMNIIPFFLEMMLITAIITAAGTQQYIYGDEQNIQLTDSWSMFQHDPSHTGYTIDDGPDTDHIKWNNYAYDNPNHGLAVVDGNIYVGSSGYLHCIDAKTGTLKWRVPIGSYVYSAPAVNSGNIYIGSTVYVGSEDNEWDGKICCIDAATSEKKWEYTTEGLIDGSSPTVVNNRVYIGTHDHAVYCLDATTGSKIWIYITGDIIYSSPAVVENKVYIGSNDGKVYCLNAETGEKIWERSTKASTDTYSFVKSSPAVVNGCVFIGSTNRVYQGTQFLYGYGKVFCLDAANGHIIWEYTNFRPPQMYFGPIVSSPAVFNDRIYIGSYRAYNGYVPPITGEMYCFDADPSDGTDEGIDDPSSATYDLVWSYQTQDGVVAPPVLSGNGFVYFVDLKGNVYCLNASTGEQQWSKELTFGFSCAPALADGDLYVMNSEGMIFCFGANLPPEQPDQPNGPTVGLPDVNYTFSTVSSDPEGQNILYYWDWGDDTWTWVGPLSSGEQVIVNHSWDTVGTYSIRIYAVDILHKKSTWSEPLTIRIIDPQVVIGKITGGWGGLLKQGKVSAELKNLGDDAFNIEWSITVTGGLFDSIHMTKSGSISSLKAGATQHIAMTSIRGIGPVTITITITVDGVQTVSKKAEGHLFFMYLRVKK
ncbi:MAG: PQQ-binding-like beta-propeller repeat protein [Candidatus Thermoplasmatota archaeon]